MARPTPATGLPPQAEFNFEHHLPAGMETFSIPFLSRWFHTSDTHWINLIEAGDLPATDLSRKNKTKTMWRVTRSELVRHLNSRSQ